MTEPTVLRELIVGESPAVRGLRETIARAARASLPVLIEGPTGAGKELVAEGLHLLSGRRGALVPVNVCAVADTMFEDALFGHVRGAFSGAVQDARGYLAEAHGGTLFLDEIGGLPAAAQAKLLRALETRRFRPVGAREDRASDFRVVAATNEPLHALVAAGRFRADLAYRLGGLVLAVPSLAARREDIPLLARHFAARVGLRVSPEAERVLEARAWPGNVRELRYAVERAAALSDEGGVLDRAGVERALGGGDLPVGATFASHGASGGEHFARRRLTDLLESAGWDTAEAARRLGVHRATVYRRMTRLGIAVPDVVLREGVVEGRVVEAMG